MKFDNYLPSEQHDWPSTKRLDPRQLHRRRESVFLAFAGLFLGTLAMLNLIGITRFLDLKLALPFTDAVLPLPVAVGVLPYPLTFLCTDLISELYGKSRANLLVWIGLALNGWIVFILVVGGMLPGHPSPVFDGMRELALGAVLASMVAYLLAQFIDVKVFHYLKKKTKGKKLWLRNNGSTLISQLIDTTAVILITHFYADALPIDSEMNVWPQLMHFIVAGYLFKLLAALLDTLPFYWLSRRLKIYLRLPPGVE